MKASKFLLLLILGLLLSSSLLSQNTPLPYFCGFETPEEESGWEFKKAIGSKFTTNFTIGGAVHCIGKRSMYVSNDGGVTANYQQTISGYQIVAYRKFTFSAGDYDFMFDYRIAGESTDNNDVMRVAYFPTTKADGSAQNPKATQMGDEFSEIVRVNAFRDENGEAIFASSGWKTIKGMLNIPADGDYWVAFYFKANGNKVVNPPGACVDNVQIGAKKLPTDCAALPLNMKVEKTPTNTPTDITVSWTGNSTSYDLIYFNATSSQNTSYHSVHGIVGNSYSIPLANIPEGNYSFRLRGVCETDTSLWVGVSNMLVYDPSLHCLDYLNFYADGVVCYTGVFTYPLQRQGPIDNGYDKITSMHTVHYLADEYDKLTGYNLKTVPEGALASVRLSNWQEDPSPSGAIEYKYTVMPDAKVLLLKYAAVLQYASHHPAEGQTRIHVEIFGANGVKLDSACTEVDFNAKDVELGNTRGWQTYQPTEADGLKMPEVPIKWLDWQVLGINMASYIGQTVKIRISMHACDSDFHFGYGYFVLDCNNGDFEGMSCGVVPTTLTPPEGFKYRWYLVDDPTKKTISTEREFIVEKGDIKSYYVDLIYPENPECYFTLKAYTLPRIPKSRALFTHQPHDCINEVTIKNNSGVFTYHEGKEELAEEKISEYFWTFGLNGEYGTSNEFEPTLIVPNEGDTFDIILRTLFNGCDDIDTFRVEVPTIRTSYAKADYYICEGQETEFNGKKYSEAGVYIDTLITKYGCDSILEMTLKVLKTDTIPLDTTICSNQQIDFYGTVYNKTGKYEHRLPSSLGCDSIYYSLDLTVLEALELTISNYEADICADSINFSTGFTLTSGTPSGYKIVYGEAAKAQGFVDTDVITDMSENIITIVGPKDVRPDSYSAKVTFFNSDCGDATHDFTFDVKYSSSIITQRWNDFLGVVRKENYEFIGFSMVFE